MIVTPHRPHNTEGNGPETAANGIRHIRSRHGGGNNAHNHQSLGKYPQRDRIFRDRFGEGGKKLAGMEEWRRSLGGGRSHSCKNTLGEKSWW